MLEELATAWMTVAVGLSVHTMSCYPLAAFGTDEQRDALLPDLLAGDLLGGYALSEPESGLGRGGAAHPRGARRRQLHGDRDQGMDHPRGRGRLLRS